MSKHSMSLQDILDEVILYNILTLRLRNKKNIQKQIHWVKHKMAFEFSVSSFNLRNANVQSHPLSFSSGSYSLYKATRVAEALD